MSERLVWIVAGTITAVWVLTTLVMPFLIHDYTPPPGVSAVMGALAGGAGAYLFAKRSDERRNGNAEEKEKPRKGSGES